uniref:Intercellular adhesion molecule N-terminal domain-containing protein n=1 Tax=Chelonoidis abingdonii TaxID=106734 RepID=A0A8C0QKJ2_CHEAB
MVNTRPKDHIAELLMRVLVLKTIVSPEAPMVEHGGSVWINCTTTCQDPGARGGLETSLIKTDSKSGPGWAAFLLVGITEWVSAPQCYFVCGGDMKVTAANISSYRKWQSGQGTGEGVWMGQGIWGRLLG